MFLDSPLEAIGLRLWVLAVWGKIAALDSPEKNTPGERFRERISAHSEAGRLSDMVVPMMTSGVQ